MLGRRKYPRVEISFPVRLEDAAGRTWHGESVNLSPGGLKVKTDANLQVAGCASTSGSRTGSPGSPRLR